MASSSAFTVGLLNALFEFQNKKINNKDLAKESIYFEQRILKEIVGCKIKLLHLLAVLTLLKLLILNLN